MIHEWYEITKHLLLNLKFCFD
jgi:hypothetical protein